jgi:TonB family protein
VLDRPAQRQGFLISTLVHLVVLTVIAAHGVPDRRQTEPSDASALPPTARERVFLPSPEELRRLLPARPPAARPSAPMTRPTPPPPNRAKDRISVGSPSSERSKGPIVLRRDDDLTAIPPGTPGAVSAPPPPASSPAPPASPAWTGEAGERPRAPGLTLPPGLGRLLSEDRGSLGEKLGRPASIASAARDYAERNIGDGAVRGLPSGTGKQMGPLFFDPAGADFTEWINQFKNEVYRNWILPQAALLGFKGDVDLAFVVARDGTLLDLTLVSSSGTAALDRAARNAIQGSRLLPLPADYGPNEITMRVRFVYG